MNVEAENILVCGLGSSGIALAKLLCSIGKKVSISDTRKLEDINLNIEELNKLNINFYLGTNPDDIVQNYDLIVVSPGIDLETSFIKKAKNCNIEVWGEIELAYKFCKATIVGITGTNGKSTTTSLVGKLLETKSKTYCLGNIGTPFSQTVLNMKENEFVSLELSSFQLETCFTFKPKISVILNITEDHLNRHKTMENYVNIKSNIFANQNESDFVILNYDDNNVRSFHSKINAKVIFFSLNKIDEGVFIDEKGFICVKLFDIDEVIIHKNEVNVVLENVLASIAIALCEGIELKVISKIIRGFVGLQHRMEFVTYDKYKGVYFYNDSKATNPESAIKALQSIQKPIVLIGGGHNKGSSYDDWVKQFKHKVKLLIVIGESSKDIVSTCDKYNFTNYVLAKSLKEAVQIAYDKAENNDCVMLSPACASYDMFNNFEHRGNLFKEFVLGAINSNESKYC